MRFAESGNPVRCGEGRDDELEGVRNLVIDKAFRIDTGSGSFFVATHELVFCEETAHEILAGLGIGVTEGRIGCPREIAVPIAEVAVLPIEPRCDPTFTFVE